MSNYIPLFYVDVIIHLCHISHAIFCSAADIVSGAYPMPIHASSVCPSSTFFLKLNRLPNCFHLIFPIFGLNVHNNIAPKVLEVEFWFFFVSHLLTDRWLQKRQKIGIWKVYHHILKKSLIWDHETWFSGVWEMALVAQIGFRLFSWKFSTGFTLNLMCQLIGYTYEDV